MPSKELSSKENSIIKLRRKITFIAFYSRCCVLILQALFNLLITDHESDGFITPAMNSSKTQSDDQIFLSLGGLTRWDAQHFLHISVYGYVYEHSLAFFPAFPTVIRIFGSISRPILPFLNTLHRHIIVSLSVNLLCFVWSARVLFNLSYAELGDKKLAYLSAVFFSINPASIFFSAIYSETLFSLLSFSAMLSDKLIPCCLLVALSASTRSNGILNVGYPLYKSLVRFVDGRRNVFTTLVFSLKVLSVSVMSITLFLLFQIYSYHQFCGIFPHHFDPEIVEMAEYKKYVLSGTGSKGMCNSTIPYFYIQNHYWNVGPFHYFCWKQLPNFMIALPILSYCAFKNYEYLYPKRKLLLHHGVKAVSKFKSDSKMFPYVIHLSALLIVCFFFVHIQVSTRLLCSSSPLLYWYFAKSLNGKVRENIKFSVKDISTLLASNSRVLYYCLAYYLVGILLFSNFLPWT